MTLLTDGRMLINKDPILQTSTVRSRKTHTDAACTLSVEAVTSNEQPERLWETLLTFCLYEKNTLTLCNHV